MADILQSMGVSEGAIWQFLGQFATWLLILVIAMVVIVSIIAIIFYNLYNKKLIVFPGYGDSTHYIEEVEIKDKDGKISTVKQLKNIDGIALGIPKIKKAKFIRDLGMTRIELLSPFRYKTSPVSPEFIYAEGVYAVNIGHEYIPIRKPGIDAEKGYLVKLGNWQQYKEANFLTFKKFRQKFADKDEKLRIFAMLIIVCVLCVLLTGFVLWLSFSNVTKLHTDFQMLGSVIQGAAQNLGGNIPG